MLTPREYQEDGLRALNETELQRPMVAWATGLGKTVLFGHWIKRRKGRSLIIAHREELIQQAAQKVKIIDPDAHVGIVKAQEDDVRAQIVIASIQTLARARRLKRLMKAGDFKSLVVDEAHHSEADTYQRVMQTLGCFEHGGPMSLGVTATPDRHDGKALGKTWQGIIHHMSILDGIKDGYLCNLKAMRVKIDADFKKLHTRHGDIKDEEAARMLLDADAPYHIAQAIKENASDRPTLVFTPTVAVAYAVAAQCIRAGLTAEALDGTTPADDRAAMLKRFHRSITHVLCNCAVLTEGYDEEVIACVVMARPTKSEPFYIQCIGRGTRPHPSKEDCLIIDVVGVTERHDLITASVLQTEDEEPDVPEPMHEEEDEEEWGRSEKEKREPTTIEGAALSMDTVDLFASRPFAWVQTNFGYVLDMGKTGGWVLLEEHDEDWTTSRMVNVGNNYEHEVRFISRFPNLGYAQGSAEDFVRGQGAVGLCKKDAHWRNGSVTTGQAYMAERWRIELDEDWTKGMASDAITQKIAEANFHKATHIGGKR